MIPVRSRIHRNRSRGSNSWPRRSVAATAYSILVVGPAMLLGAPWLADQLSESPLTREYATVALRMVPLLCLAGAPFLLYRPVFEGMQRGTPGLAIAAVRYVLLTGPFAWLGIGLAVLLGQPALYGLLVGLLAAAAVASAIFHVWLRAALLVPGAAARGDRLGLEGISSP